MAFKIMTSQSIDSKHYLTEDLPVNQLSVLGSGTMGCGIALCLAHADLPVILWSRKVERKVKGRIVHALQEEFHELALSRGEINRFLSNIYITSELNLVAESDIVIEAVVEDLEVKRELFKRLSNICLPSTILASNSSTFTIHEIASQVLHPERVIGMHFFNPAYQTSIIEVVCGKATSEETFSLINKLARLLNKEVIRVEDKPGFIVSQLTLGFLTHAINLLEQGSITPEELDRAMCLSGQIPVGPLALADQIGLDNLLYSLNSLYTKLAKEQYRPPLLLKKMIDEGRLGKKSGEGFYKYL